MAIREHLAMQRVDLGALGDLSLRSTSLPPR